MSVTTRVLWVSTSPRTRGGIATVVRTMRATPLWNLWSIRHVATHRDGPIPARIGAFAVGLAAFLGEVVRDRPVLVHVHTASDGSFARKAVVCALCRILALPVVLQVHGGAFVTFHRDSPRFLRALVERTLTDAAVVVALGEVWAARLAVIAPRARIEVVPNAVRPRSVVGQPPAGTAVHVLFLGAVCDDKGVFVLLDAWTKLRAELGDRVPVRLTVAGDGELARARSRVAELGVDDSVEVTGWIPVERIPDLLRTAQVLVLPSRAECQPMAILEAMANGLCVVATDVGGIPDLVDTFSGILVPADDPHALTDALRTVVTDGELRARMGRSALARIESEFDVDVVWRRFDSIYRSVTT